MGVPFSPYGSKQETPGLGFSRSSSQSRQSLAQEKGLGSSLGLQTMAQLFGMKMFKDSSAFSFFCRAFVVFPLLLFLREIDMIWPTSSVQSSTCFMLFRVYAGVLFVFCGL